MNLNELNSIGYLDVEKPIEKIKDLKLGVQYKIHKCRRVTTRFGPTIVIELESCAAYLPKRFADITDEQVAELNSGRYSVENTGSAGYSNSLKFSEIKNEKINLSELNTIGHLEAEKPIEKIRNLKLGVQYKIYKCRRVTTRFGPTIVLELESCTVFLPKRFADITDEQVAKFNSGRYSVENTGSAGYSNFLKFSKIEN